MALGGVALGSVALGGVVWFAVGSILEQRGSKRNTVPAPNTPSRNVCLFVFFLLPAQAEAMSARTHLFTSIDIYEMHFHSKIC